jgi:DNA-binding CsgD family transcriptional regulator
MKRRWALSPRENEVMICRCFEELTLIETGAKLGMAPSSANTLTWRARRKLGARTIRGACALLALRSVTMRDGRQAT